MNDFCNILEENCEQKKTIEALIFDSVNYQKVYLNAMQISQIMMIPFPKNKLRNSKTIPTDANM